MRLQPIVEGHGEVEAFPILLRRLVMAAEAWNVTINTAVRQPRGRLVKQQGLTHAIRLARTSNCQAMLVLIDGDDDCPAELGPRLQEWADAEMPDIPCEVVIAHREYEAWFLAAAASLRAQCGIRADAPAHPHPESPRDAKARLEARMVAGRTYLETLAQPRMSAAFSLAQAWQASRSFRKLASSFGALLAQTGHPTGAWPPASWKSP